ncbi:HAMP domain-containing histidine kinase [Streptosporangiaceae bacterium NEAU-GS5]|nr:HAMP domain-containing histidine kinase [Streptosporangiaceae bacterium NEAU-GS5]
MSLRVRLLAGLLVVGALLLVVLSVVSAIVLRGHLLERLEGQLAAATATAAKRVTDTALPDTLTGSTYAVVVFNLTSHEARLTDGDAPDASAVPALAERVGETALAAYAKDQRTFDLDASGEYALMARAAYSRWGNRIVVVAVPMDAVDDPVRHLLLSEAVTGGFLIGFLALGGRLLIARGLAPLDRMAARAHRVAKGGDLSVRMPEGTAEIGRLGAAVNMMLDRIAGAFYDRWASEERVRRFAADASHELRTPLSTIRGYAELLRSGAIPPEDQAKVAGRIEDEAVRMGKLVGELLELARLDRRGGLDLAEVDLVEIAREVAADRAAVAPGSPVAVSGPESMVVVADEARIRQVLLNLLTNVSAHTPPGTPATVRLALNGDQVMIEVADKGPGIPPEQMSIAFERFRGGTSAGAGLGLSIVRAIAEAHGGHCRIDSSPGEGLTVHVELALTPG